MEVTECHFSALSQCTQTFGSKNYSLVFYAKDSSSVLQSSQKIVSEFPSVIAFSFNRISEAYIKGIL